MKRLLLLVCLVGMTVACEDQQVELTTTDGKSFKGIGYLDCGNVWNLKQEDGSNLRIGHDQVLRYSTKPLPVVAKPEPVKPKPVKAEPQVSETDPIVWAMLAVGLGMVGFLTFLTRNTPARSKPFDPKGAIKPRRSWKDNILSFLDGFFNVHETPEDSKRFRDVFKSWRKI